MSTSTNAADGIRQPVGDELSPLVPHAKPNIPITINGGFKMPGWYDIISLDRHEKREDKAGMMKTVEISELSHFLKRYNAKRPKKVKGLIQKELDAGISAKKIVLGGFSQGSAMTLLTSLLIEHELAGFVALSGYLPLSDEAEQLAKDVNLKTPYFMGHGTSDNVVEFKWGEMSYEKLKAMGRDVTFKSYRGMGHSASEDELLHIGDFLRKDAPPPVDPTPSEPPSIPAPTTIPPFSVNPTRTRNIPKPSVTPSTTATTEPTSLTTTDVPTTGDDDPPFTFGGGTKPSTTFVITGNGEDNPPSTSSALDHEPVSNPGDSNRPLSRGTTTPTAPESSPTATGVGPIRPGLPGSNPVNPNPGANLVVTAPSNDAPGNSNSSPSSNNDQPAAKPAGGPGKPTPPSGPGSNPNPNSNPSSNSNTNNNSGSSNSTPESNPQPKTSNLATILGSGVAVLIVVVAAVAGFAYTRQRRDLFETKQDLADANDPYDGDGGMRSKSDLPPLVPIITKPAKGASLYIQAQARLPNLSPIQTRNFLAPSTFQQHKHTGSPKSITSTFSGATTAINTAGSSPQMAKVSPPPLPVNFMFQTTDAVAFAGKDANARLIASKMHLPAIAKSKDISKLLQMAPQHFANMGTVKVEDGGLRKRRWSLPSQTDGEVVELQEMRETWDELDEEFYEKALRRDAIQDLVQPSTMDVLGVRDFILPKNVAPSIQTVETDMLEKQHRHGKHHRHHAGEVLVETEEPTEDWMQTLKLDEAEDMGLTPSSHRSSRSRSRQESPLQSPSALVNSSLNRPDTPQSCCSSCCSQRNRDDARSISGLTLDGLDLQGVSRRMSIRSIDSHCSVCARQRPLSVRSAATLAWSIQESVELRERHGHHQIHRLLREELGGGTVVAGPDDLATLRGGETLNVPATGRVPQLPQQSHQLPMHMPRLRIPASLNIFNGNAPSQHSVTPTSTRSPFTLFSTAPSSPSTPRPGHSRQGSDDTLAFTSSSPPPGGFLNIDSTLVGTSNLQRSLTHRSSLTLNDEAILEGIPQLVIHRADDLSGETLRLQLPTAPSPSSPAPSSARRGLFGQMMDMIAGRSASSRTVTPTATPTTPMPPLSVLSTPTTPTPATFQHVLDQRDPPPSPKPSVQTLDGVEAGDVLLSEFLPRVPRMEVLLDEDEEETRESVVSSSASSVRSLGSSASRRGRERDGDESTIGGGDDGASISETSSEGSAQSLSRFLR
ncbi:hypothetical protein HDU97_009334 [Phlyctochytrium planicorne]|nr:hypothetical protein HDU97_009334 [Phlyctochytrium planicorne]